MKTKITSDKIDLAALKQQVVHVVVFGHGNVGGAFLDQLFRRQESLLARRNLDLRVIVVANSTTAVFEVNGVPANWKAHKKAHSIAYQVQDVLAFVKVHELNNLIAIDNTANKQFTDCYETLITHGFHVVSSNKHKNTGNWKSYLRLRQTLREFDKSYLYETNVGAGLPLIDTINLLHQSGENITRIRGVFSGSLSYIFNIFSESDVAFSSVLRRAVSQGFTEPDPREDLCGMDVARKLLILARELELAVELEDVAVHNLVPKHMRKCETSEFLNTLEAVDAAFLIKKKNVKPDHVLRYVADLNGDLSRPDGGNLSVSLQETPRNSMLGQLRGSDSIFEIYTESYGSNPIVIQGAGAGSQVTARGVFGDVLRICNKL